MLTRYGVLGMALALGGCGGLETIEGPTPPPSVRIQVSWKPEACPEGLIACAIPADPCLIFVKKPEGFDDWPRLISLGHEVLHCLGWKHIP